MAFERFLHIYSSFLFMFSHFGDHGLGDSARIPIGHGKAIQEVDGIQAYIQDEGPISMIEIDRFKITDDFVYGFISNGNENYEGSYFVYDLMNNSIKTFEEESDYLNLLKTKNLTEILNIKILAIIMVNIGMDGDFGFYHKKAERITAVSRDGEKCGKFTFTFILHPGAIPIAWYPKILNSNRVNLQCILTK